MTNDKRLFSNTSIKTYHFCPQKYKLQFVNKYQGNKNLQNKYFSFDSTLHSVMAKLNSLNHKKLELITDNYITSLIEKSWVHTGYENANEELKYKRKAFSIIKYYLCSPKDIGSETLVINKVLRTKFSKDVTLSAKVDKVYKRKDGKVEIIDYKSGSIIDRNISFKRNIQIALYLLATNGELEIFPHYISFYYLRYNEIITYRVDKSSIKTAKMFIKSYLNFISTDTTYNCNPSPYCNSFCVYYDNCNSNNIEEKDGGN